MKNEKKENENENVMSSQEMRACMNKIFDNGMAAKRYDAMIAMLNMIGHSVLLLNDIVVSMMLKNILIKISWMIIK